MKIFDRRRYKLHQDRAAALLPKAAFMRDFLESDIKERLRDVARGFPSVAIIGGRVSEDFLSFLVAEKAAASIDIACMGQAQRAAQDQEAASHAACISLLTMREDEEILPLTPAGYDLVIDAGHLHHVNDLPGMLIQSRMALKPDGLFIGVMAGGDNLHQLRSSLIAAETALYEGASPRVSPFVPLQTAAGLMQRAGFALPVVDHDILRVDYRSLHGLMQDLRALGETSCLAQASRSFRPASFFAAAEHHYRNDYGNKDGTLPADYEFIYLHGWAPHESQQQPLRRGSADASLADIL